MTVVYLTKHDIKMGKEHKSIEDLRLTHFNVSVSPLMYAHSIVFIDEDTKQTHNLR